MGLDQHAWAEDPRIESIEAFAEGRDLTEAETDIVIKGRIEIAKWRKHADLNAWMEQLYRDRGNLNEFNCTKLLLNNEDLDNLERHLNEHNGYEVQGEGFFWGQSDQEDIFRDREFIRNARKCIAEGYIVYYYCWW